jgi:monoamine oxidase
MMTPYISDNSPADGSKCVLVTFMLPTTSAPKPYLTLTDDVLNDKALRARRLAQDLATVFGDDRFLSGQYTAQARRRAGLLRRRRRGGQALRAH